MNLLFNDSNSLPKKISVLYFYFELLQVSNSETTFLELSPKLLPKPNTNKENIPLNIPFIWK